MGSAWSYEDPECSMRIASREVCDDETWANTVQNRSPCSVQQRLDMMQNADFDFDVNFFSDYDSSSQSSLDDLPVSPSMRKRHRPNRRLFFSEKNSVRLYTVERPIEEEVVSSDDDSLDAFDIDIW